MCSWDPCRLRKRMQPIEWHLRLHSIPFHFIIIIDSSLAHITSSIHIKSSYCTWCERLRSHLFINVSHLWKQLIILLINCSCIDFRHAEKNKNTELLHKWNSPTRRCDERRFQRNESCSCRVRSPLSSHQFGVGTSKWNLWGGIRRAPFSPYFKRDTRTYEYEQRRAEQSLQMSVWMCRLFSTRQTHET